MSLGSIDAYYTPTVQSYTRYPRGISPRPPEPARGPSNLYKRRRTPDHMYTCVYERNEQALRPGYTGLYLTCTHAMFPASPKNSAWAASWSVQMPTFLIRRLRAVLSSVMSRAKASYICKALLAIVLCETCR